MVLPDGARAYTNYCHNQGNDLTLTYQKAIQDDLVIKQAVEAKTADVVTAATRLFDG
jgi:hypothetical protein